ncbi:hypothetical protein IAR55_001200 [Kwoniella newhampshirensis]|uniref:Uncharacterized protein n=1 Tax=Kwoniella newhampshirensis TaxID=1651941 RepID=A0AAW0Z500_9TREE
MNDSGLPIAFGKQHNRLLLPTKPSTNNQGRSSSQGDTGERSRGSVAGGGRPNRGRGRGGRGAAAPSNFASGSNSSVIGSRNHNTPASDTLNTGVKRPSVTLRITAGFHRCPRTPNHKAVITQEEGEELGEEVEGEEGRWGVDKGIGKGERMDRDTLKRASAKTRGKTC